MPLANYATCFRLATVPGLLLLAWRGQGGPFAALLLASFVSDVLDGWLARRFGSSALGPKLDTVGDAALYVCLPLCAIWLVPGVVADEAVPIAIVLFLFGYKKITLFCHLKKPSGLIIFLLPS